MNAKFAFSALAALLLLPAASLRAQGNPAAAPAPAPTKVGVVNLRAAIFNTAEGKQASAELQSQFAPLENELENLRKQIEEAQNKLRAGQATMSQEEKARLARQVDQWTRAGQRKQQQYEEEANYAQNEIGQRILAKMQEIVNKYALENGFAVVFDVSGQSTPVVYASNQVDITQDMIRLYDQANPVRSSTAPGQPARPATPPGQTKPAQPQPQPPPKPPQQ